MLSNRVEVAESFARLEAKKDPTVVGAVVGGSSARGDCLEISDIDIRLFFTDNHVHGESAHTRSNGFFLDVEYWSVSTWNAEELLSDPYRCGFAHDAIVLHDKDGLLKQVQETVRREFENPKWMRIRLSSLTPGITRNLTEFSTAIAENDSVEICRACIFALWTVCDFLLVRQGVSPSWVRGLQKLQDHLPDDVQRIVQIEDTESLSPGDAADYLPFWEESIGTAGLLGEIEYGIEWMIRNGLHREAFHALWIGFGLGLKGLSTSDAGNDTEKAQQLAASWLSKRGWNTHVLKSREAELGALIDLISEPGLNGA